MLVRVCDLCGKEISEPDYYHKNVRRYQIRRYESWFDHERWNYIDAHRDCIVKLFEAAKKNKEENFENEEKDRGN